MLEVLRQDFVVTARSKGLPTTTVTERHALKNALLTNIAYAWLDPRIRYSGNWMEVPFCDR